MMLYFENALRQRNLTYKEAFKVAYYWKFQKVADLTEDIKDFGLTRIMPKYVVDWLLHLQGDRNATSNSSVQVPHD